MLIDCETCQMDGTPTCDDCIVPFLLGAGGVTRLVDDEKTALRNLAEVGLVPPIRLVPQEDEQGSAAG